LNPRSVPETSLCNLCWVRLTSGLSTGFYYRYSVLAVTLVETGFRKGRPAAKAFFFDRWAHPEVFAFAKYCVGGRGGEKKPSAEYTDAGPLAQIALRPLQQR